MRRQIIRDLQENYPQIQDIPYDMMLNMDIFDLHALIEHRKLEVRMHDAAVRLQRQFRLFIFRKYCFNKRMRQEKAARKLQAQWKVHRRRGFMLGIRNHGAYLACTKVQKYLKGYVVSKAYEQRKI